MRARQAAIAGNEPSDAVRVVNALLTQLDALRRYPNALVLATSNISGAIDAAFIDRADIKQYIGPPGPAARYDILCGCTAELQRANLVVQSTPFMGASTVRRQLPHPPPAFHIVDGLGIGGAVDESRNHSIMLSPRETRTRACRAFCARCLPSPRGR